MWQRIDYTIIALIKILGKRMLIKCGLIKTKKSRSCYLTIIPNSIIISRSPKESTQSHIDASTIFKNSVFIIPRSSSIKVSYPKPLAIRLSNPNKYSHSDIIGTPKPIEPCFKICFIGMGWIYICVWNVWNKHKIICGVNIIVYSFLKGV